MENLEYLEETFKSSTKMRKFDEISGKTSSNLQRNARKLRTFERVFMETFYDESKSEKFGFI